MTDPPPASPADDTDARRAASDPGQSVLLEAPAGSGKTSVLTERFLRLLCTVERPDEILAITFTRKAAAEMRARITRALAGTVPATDPNAPLLHALAGAVHAHGAPRGWRLAEEPQALAIQTIDAFNYWLASQLPVAARIGGALEVTEQPQALYGRAARRALTAADSEPELRADAQLLFERQDNRWMRVEQLLAQMLAERGHWLRFVVGEDPDALCARVNEALAALARRALEAACARIPAALRARAQALPGVGTLGADGAQLPHWRALVKVTRSATGWRRKLETRYLGGAYADPAARAALRDVIDDLAATAGAEDTLAGIAASPAAALAAEDVAAIRALSRLLARAAAELHAEFADARQVDYTYVTGAARQALAEGGEPTDLALRAGLNLRHILVDEFQDTSLDQYELLRTLTAGWEPGDGRTLFVVGDPMQSIYRFRDAEVGLFLRARMAGIGALALRPLRLVRNFRAAPALVEFCNEAFAALFPPGDDMRRGAVAYRPSVAARAAPPALIGIPPVTLQLFPDERAHEAQEVAARIARLRTLDPGASVAVLVSAHTHAVPVVAALEARGVPVLGVDLVPLRERMVVRDLVQLARALWDPADRAAWLAVLRAPWCGAQLASLSALSQLYDEALVPEALADPARLARCLPEDRAHLGRVREVLVAAVARRGAQPVAGWLEATWLQLGGADAYPAAELADARTFFSALAERAARGEWRGPEDFPLLLGRLFSTGIPAGEAPVQVMTIHRAKGLEFEHVLVPALERATPPAELRLLRWVDLPAPQGQSELLISPAPAVEAHADDALNAHIKGVLRERDEFERQRLLYVAATRARRTLWLSGAPKVKDDGLPRPDRRSLLAILWPALGERFALAGAAAAVTAAGTREVPLARLRADWAPAALPAGVQVSLLPPSQLPAEPPEFSWVGETQRHIGTVVHARLAAWALEGQRPDPGAAAAARPLLAAQLARLGVPAAEQARAVELVVSALARTLADDRGRWILDPAHRAAHAELALTGVSGGRLRSIVIDRSFVDADGTRWVIDYKTSRHEGGGVEAFLDAEVERYRGQLAGYVDLLRRLGPEPVRAGLYFPLLGAFREVAVGPG
jgi:ATP-dependent exoDNAse (exonuclease V) beta subunit